MNMSKSFYWFVMSLVILGNLLLLYFAYMIFYPFQIVDMQTFEVRQAQVQKGGFVRVHMVFDKKINATPHVTWLLVDGMTYKLTNGETGKTMPKGIQDREATFFIPNSEAIQAGKYQIQAQMEYDIFPLRQPIAYTWITNSFEVVER